MSKSLLISLAIAALSGASLTAAASVQLSIRDGRVWLIADHATAAQILTEWARVGHTEMVNTEKIAGEPLTLDLAGVSELEALDVIMRSTGGFITVSRAAGLADGASNLSSFSRLVMVPSRALPDARAARIAPAMPAAPAAALPPAVQAPILTESGAERLIGADGQPVPDDQEDAPPPPPRPPQALPPGMSMPPGFSEPPGSPPPDGAAVPDVITRPTQSPRPGGAPIT